MRTLDERQKRILKIYDNLRQDAQSFTPSARDPHNFAEQLLNDFMQEPSFLEGMRAIATDFVRSDVLKTLDAPRAQTPRLGFAENLMAAVDRGDEEMLVDLVRAPANPTLPLHDLNSFWNIVANLQTESPELYTHIVADPRYVSFFEQTVAANEMQGEHVADLRRDVLAAHHTAYQTVNDVNYDKFQLGYHGMAENLYNFVQQGDFDVIGAGLTRESPNNLFSARAVAAPLPAEKLAETSVPVDQYHNEIQGEKNLAALPLPETQNPEILQRQLDAFRKPAETPAPVPPTDIQIPFDKRPMPDVMAQFLGAASATPPAPENTASVNVAPNTNTDAPPENKYTVRRGDNLWNIAREQYGLKNYKDIMQAVEHIAARNNLEQGTQANRINPGQELRLPTADEIRNPVQKGLDWAALDSDIALRRTPPQMAMALN